MKTNEVRAKFDYWFNDKTLEESIQENKVLSERVKYSKDDDSGDKTAEKQHKEDSKKKQQKTSKSFFKKNAMKSDTKCAKCKGAKCKCKNKMSAMPKAAAAKPLATKNAKKADKKKLKESTAKVVYGIKEGQEVKRYAIEKADVVSALATAKRMTKTKDLSTVSFIDVIDLKENVVKTIYETLDNYKTRKRIFETHVLCSQCGSGDLELSKHRTKVRCKRCKTEDLVENIDGVKKA